MLLLYPVVQPKPTNHFNCFIVNAGRIS